MDGFLFQALTFLVAAIALVPLAERLGLGAVLGYLAAGLVLGPFGLSIISEPDSILHFAEFGVVLLLFLIGLELKPQRLWDLRRAILGAGAGQLLASAVVLSAAALALGQDLRVSILIGAGLALSSTAFALQIIEQRGWSDSTTGNTAFAILLFQDIAVIPLLALVVLLAPASTGGAETEFAPALLRAVAVIGIILWLGPRLARPLFRLVAGTGSRELFTALSLAIVCAMALVVSFAGLSMALGAFMGGVLLADSEYRHQLEIDIEPFKGLLMGLFFIAVGMSMDIGLVWREPQSIGLGLALLVGLKFVVLLLLARLLGLSGHQPWQLAALLCQGGEFGFVVFAAARGADLMTPALVDRLNAVVVLSMVLTPMILGLVERIIARRLGAGSAPAPAPAGALPSRRVIIAGYGRYGQIVGRMLQANGFEATLIDRDPDQIELAARFGATVHYGDATRLDLLVAAGAPDADLLVVALDDAAATRQVVDLARQHFPQLELVVRVRNRTEAYEMLDRGISASARETFQAALVTATQALTALGVRPQAAARAAGLFSDHDEASLKTLYAMREDDTQYVSLMAQAREDLVRLLQNEQNDAQEEEATPTDASQNAAP